MTSSITRLDTIIDRLHAQGSRVTPQRVAILKILLESDQHPSAEQVYQRVQAEYPMTSLATVYKTLTLLQELGEVQNVGTYNEVARFDGKNTAPHPHLICTRCGEIIDAPGGAMLDWAEQLARASGYHISAQRIEFFGLCPRCQQETAAEETPLAGAQERSQRD